MNTAETEMSYTIKKLEIEKMKKDEKQWDLIDKAKQVLISWAKDNNVNVFAVQFVPMFDLSLEVYVFYDNDLEIEKYLNNGISNKVKKVFINELNSLRYFEDFNEKIEFIFDSNENVVKNYQGSYFFRLR